MDAWVWFVILAVVVVAIVLYLGARKKRSEALQDRFGPEYDRTVKEAGARRGGESELAARTKRRDELDIKPLSDEARERYSSAWRETQERFVDAPTDAVTEADRLVQEVMQERGYPVDNFDQRSSDVSVDHPNVVEDYRAAHGISLANQHGEASTEDLRQAMVHYRQLFDELLETRERPAREVS
ncbi:MAG: hypothetical protein ABR529_09565 [Actinomycetota bacterium]